LTDRQLCDLEMILDGSFAPLDRFMNENDYNQVLEKMRLENGELFPLPIVLDVHEGFSNSLILNEQILLRDKEGFTIAKMTLESKWKPELKKEAQLIYNSIDTAHPAVNFLFNLSGKIYLGGKLEKVNMPIHYDYRQYRISPNELKNKFKKSGWKKIIAFQTRNPMHRAHVEMTFRSMEEFGAKLLLHPVIGQTKVGDINHYTRVRCYEHVMKEYPRNSAVLALLPMAMRMGGPREALLHAIIRKNFGCTHFIIGRDHAGPGFDSNGELFYKPYEAQDLVKKFQREIGINIIPFKLMVYVPKEKKYRELDGLEPNDKYKMISGTELRRRLDEGKKIPKWFSYPDIAKELRKSILPINKRGFTIFFTGLSGSGKSTLANGLLIKLLEEGSRPVTILDGDIVRTHLSSELGFSKEHRSLNVQRIGYVASEITKNGGIAICAPIAPYEIDRDLNKKLISKVGGYIEIYVSTSLKRCEERDSKGLYKLAREGKIKEFTGISDPYEIPVNSDITIDSDGSVAPEILIENIMEKISDIGYIAKK
tara:strand:+ start:1868 stop:3481 length:1614 start_codon:yes stop_codon:yes gene_type:complete